MKLALSGARCTLSCKSSDQQKQGGKKKAKTQESLLIYFLLLVTFVKLQIKQKCSDSKKNV